mmetsp:Transcript_5536/g.21827  ORF Transcript_5536/g.21827 Transcript_5536/m.21827 type:complete len:404 (-) Transcript_5536:1192-2403(-)
MVVLLRPVGHLHGHRHVVEDAHASIAVPPGVRGHHCRVVARTAYRDALGRSIARAPLRRGDTRGRRNCGTSRFGSSLATPGGGDVPLARVPLALQVAMDSLADPMSHAVRISHRVEQQDARPQRRKATELEARVAGLAGHTHDGEKPVECVVDRNHEKRLGENVDVVRPAPHAEVGLRRGGVAIARELLKEEAAEAVHRAVAVAQVGRVHAPANEEVDHRVVEKLARHEAVQVAVFYHDAVQRVGRVHHRRAQRGVARRFGEEDIALDTGARGPIIVAQVHRLWLAGKDRFVPLRIIRFARGTPRVVRAVPTEVPRALLSAAAWRRASSAARRLKQTLRHRVGRRAPAGLPLRLRTALDVNVGSALVPPITALVEVAQLVGAWVPLVLFPHGLEPAKYGSLET